MHHITGAETATSTAATLILLSAALLARYALGAGADPSVSADAGAAASATDTTPAGRAANRAASRTPEPGSGTGLPAAPATR